MKHKLPDLICESTGVRTQTRKEFHSAPDGKPWRLDWQSHFPKNLIQQRPPEMWRYREAFPVDVGDHVSLGESITPLVQADFAGRKVFLKCEHQLPSGSYKDRGAALLISALKKAGIKRIKEDSSGNAGAALAAYAARAGLQARIFVPESASGGKLRQIRSSGARLETIPGPRQAATDACLNSFPDEYYASHIWNPFFEHGVKTMAFEIVEQLNWRFPEVVVIPVGHGGLLLALWRGFTEMHQAGIIHTRPRLIAVQARNCAPLAAKWNRQKSENKETIAEGIAISEPVRGDEVIDAVKESGGSFHTVREDQIEKAHRTLSGSGFCIEPTSAVALAAWREMTDLPIETVITLTGHGLKNDQ